MGFATVQEPNSGGVSGRSYIQAPVHKSFDNWRRTLHVQMSFNVIITSNTKKHPCLGKREDSAAMTSKELDFSQNLFRRQHSIARKVYTTSRTVKNSSSLQNQEGLTALIISSRKVAMPYDPVLV
jgi:hypothetical protein